MLEAAAPKMREVAPKHLKVERVVRLLLAACSRNPALLECEPNSVLLFCMRCSETGLEPIGAGGAWPVPYRNKKTGKTEMQFIPDYRGLVNCAKRAGCITDAYAEIVRANDEFDYALGLEPCMTHKPARGDRGALEAAYCVFVLPDGAKRFVVMDADEVLGIKARSKASEYGPWVTDEGEMWKKTVVRRAMKPFAGMSKELDAAIAADDAATGLTAVVREPIREPKAVDVVESAPASPEPTPAAPVSEPGPANHTQTAVEGVLEDVLESSGTTKAGRPWRKFALVVAGEKYGTFDTDIGEGAVAWKGRKVSVLWEADGKYRKLLNVALIEPCAAPVDGVGEGEELPL
jgi:recombination protein RecT